MTEETLGRPSCLPTSRPDLKPTQSPSLRGWRNTRLAQKNNSTTLSTVTVLGARWTAKNPFSLTSLCKTLINARKPHFGGLEHLLWEKLSPTQDWSWEKKLFISLVCYMRRRLQFVHNIFYHMKIRQFLSCAVSYQGLIFWESSIFKEKIEQRNKPCNIVFKANE